MTAHVPNWTPAELAAISQAEEVHVSSRRRDGTLSDGRTIWTVVVDGSVFIRSTDGPDKPVVPCSTQSRRRPAAGG